MSQGYILLHRQICDNWIWKDKPFSYGQAWIDLLMMANHTENKFPLGNEIVTVEAGSLVTSEVKLADRWGWSKSKVRRFLMLLESDGMIKRKTDRKKTMIFIENYGIFQHPRITEKSKENYVQTERKPTADTNKECKNNELNNSNNEEYIVDFLNMKAGTNYRPFSKSTRELIRARFAEGFTVEDFEAVIEKKCAEWLGDEKMEKYLRPETLFGDRFESYLNAKITKMQINTGMPIDYVDPLEGLF